MFESNDLLARNNEYNVLTCLYEVACYGIKFGIMLPNVVTCTPEVELNQLRRDEKQQQQQKGERIYQTNRTRLYMISLIYECLTPTSAIPRPLPSSSVHSS